MAGDSLGLGWIGSPKGWLAHAASTAGPGRLRAHWGPHAAASAGLAAGYFAAGKLGLTLAFVHASATAVWPPTGIALGGLLLLGYRVWPGVLVGAFLVNLTTAGSAVSSAGIAVGNTAEGLVGAYLVNRFAGGRHAFERPRDVFRFTVLAALTSTLVSASVGVTSLSLTGYAEWADFGSIWFTWWLGDAGGALLVAPLVVLWGTRRPSLPPGRRRLEAAGGLLAVVVTGLATFGGTQPLSTQHAAIEFVVFPALVWAAFRFGPRETATATVVLSGLAIWGTLRGFGPFVRASPNESLLLLQAFMGVTAATSIALAAAMLERRRAEEALRVARAEAEAALHLRDEFLSVAAHELKTPLTGLLTATQLLVSQLDRGAPPEPDAHRQRLRVIEERAQHLRRLVAQLLDISRIQSGKLALELQELDLARLVPAVAAATQAGTGWQQVVVHAPSPARVCGDPLRLEQVVTNLLDNAVRFSPGGGQIEVEVSTPSAGLVRLAVRDHGLGIPPEKRAHIFDRYYQAHVAEHRSGLGLGLSISRQIVELHGGQITAEFPPDGGTRFVIVLPAGLGSAGHG